MYRAIIFILIGLAFTANNWFESNNWQYIEIDNQKSKWGDYEGATPEWLRYFGLDMGDLNNDGIPDIVAGRWVYLNPGKDMTSPWQKIDLGKNVDGILIMDVDGDDFADVIAQALPDIVWMETTNKEATRWKAQVIGQIPETSHRNSQGFTNGQIIPGGKKEVLIASDGAVYCIQIPKKPSKDTWKIDLIADNTSDEGIGIGDMDNDGDLDIATGRRRDGEYEPLVIVWFKNPGSPDKPWEDFEIGTTNHPADRIGIAELDGKGLPEVVVCEERYPGLEPDGNLFWFGRSKDNPEQWQRHHVVTQFSLNNLDIQDIDRDGDLDIITSEHKGPNPELQIWTNNGQAEFTKEIVDSGKESHLGTQLHDMDNDGDLDIVSIGWDQHQFVHLWRNDN